MPDSPPKLWTDSTQPDSIAGISVGCGFSAQWQQILPRSPAAPRRWAGSVQWRRILNPTRGSVPIPGDARRSPRSAIIACKISTGADCPGIAGEQRRQVERPVGCTDQVHPVAREYRRGAAGPTISSTCTTTIPSWKAAASAIIGVSSVFGPVIQVPVTVGLVAHSSDDVGTQVDDHPRVQLDVGVYRADLDGAVVDESAPSARSASPAKEKSMRLQIPFSNTSRCSGRHRPRSAGAGHGRSRDRAG